MGLPMGSWRGMGVAHGAGGPARAGSSRPASPSMAEPAATLAGMSAGATGDALLESLEMERLTPSQRKELQRERNRQHARASRERRKTYIWALSKEQEMLEQRNRQLRALVSVLTDDDPVDLLAAARRRLTARGSVADRLDGAVRWPTERLSSGFVAEPSAGGSSVSSGNSESPATAVPSLPPFFVHNTLVTHPEARDVDLEACPPDPGLLSAVSQAQRSFTVSDPKVLDNPIIYSSPRFCETTEFGLGDMVGHNCRMLQGPLTDPMTKERIRAALERGRGVREVILNYTKGQRAFANSLFVEPLRDKAGQVTNFIAVQARLADYLAPLGPDGR